MATKNAPIKKAAAKKAAPAAAVAVKPATQPKAEAAAAAAAKALVKNALEGAPTGGTHKVPFNSGTPDVFLKGNSISTDAIRKMSGLDANYSDKDCYQQVCAMIHYGKLTAKDF